METEGRYTLVGMLVLAVIALMALAVVWLAGAADTIAYQTYTIYFRQQSLDGLAVGSPVKMRGIKVGVVDGFRFDRNQEEAIAVTARVNEGVPVHRGAAAYIKRNLVTGIGAIEIANGPADAALLNKAPAGERYPVIAEGRSEIDKVATAVSHLAVNGAQVLEKMNTVLSDDNQRALSHTLSNLDALSSELAANRKDLDALIGGMRDAAESFRLAGASINQAAVRTEENIAGVSRGSDKVLQEAAATLEQLRHDASQISDRLQLLSETGSLEMTTLGRDARTTAAALTTTAKRYAEPRTILYGPNPGDYGPGEQQP